MYIGILVIWFQLSINHKSYIIYHTSLIMHHQSSIIHHHSYIISIINYQSPIILTLYHKLHSHANLPLSFGGKSCASIHWETNCTIRYFSYVGKLSLNHLLYLSLSPSISLYLPLPPSPSLSLSLSLSLPPSLSLPLSTIYK